MVDDIRPHGTDKPEGQNKDGANTQPETSETRLHQPYSTPEEHQEGLVILPGKRLTKNPFKTVWIKIHNLSKKQKIIGGTLCALLLIGAGGGVYALTRSEPPPPPPPVVIETKEEPKPTTEASTLTGVQVPIGSNKRPITSIQIENSPDARPQSGLLQAGVVFEAIAEGGITRFNASFQEAKPDYIGPIRSVRPYYAELAAPFDPIFVHAGGSGAGLARLAQLSIKDLDHGPNAEAFQRVSDRYAPHNLYSSTAALDAAAKKRGYKTSKATGFERKDEEKGKPVKVKTINLSISSHLYNVSYTYDAKDNAYKRVMAGQPHKDHRSGKQITPKVVIAMVTDWHQDGIYSVYRTSGKGQAFIFQDGQVQKVTWRKKSAKAQITFTDAAGKSIPINAGQTWITLMKSSSEVTYGP